MLQPLDASFEAGFEMLPFNLGTDDYIFYALSNYDGFFKRANF